MSAFASSASNGTISTASARATLSCAAGSAAATRNPERFGVADVSRYLSFGASPRAPIHLIEGARALAYLRGRTYALPDDVTDLVPDVFRHRLVLTYEALAEGMTPDQLILRIMQRIPAPERPLETHVSVAAGS